MRIGHTYWYVLRRARETGSVDAPSTCWRFRKNFFHNNSTPNAMDPSSRHLVFHGAIVLLFGLLMGGPYGRAINRKAAEHVIQSWKVAHASLPIGALVMLAIGALLSFSPASAAVKWFIAGSLIVSSYAFCISLPMAAIVEHRGLSSDGPFTAKVVYAGNVLGAVAALAGAAGFVYASFLAISP